MIEWDSALPSRLQVTLPADVQEQIAAAQRAYHRFGQYSEALEALRESIDSQPVEKKELDRLLAQLGLPADFDVTQITWRPDYDPFFYKHLAKRARRLYLFREEYIFDLAGAIVVEIPRLGHATYFFAKPHSMEEFLLLYTAVIREDIRKNRENIAERLGFMRRLVHGANPRAWLRDLRTILDEPTAPADVTEP